MSFLVIKGLGKRFGDFVAVDGLDLEVERGEFISLLGPSGCGKTTTLQMVAGFVEPTSGSVAVGGREITKLRPEKRGMGVVFQSYALFPHMTVEQNIAFGLGTRSISRTEQSGRVGKVLELVHLKGLESRYPKELSGGQRQRVAIARALAIQPEVLLLDEPMSNLDAKLREEMHIELRAIQRHLGITTILVTHDQVEAMTMSDRIAVMHGGRIVQLNTPYGAYERPASNFASGFLGKTNRLNARILGTESETVRIKVGSIEMNAAMSNLQGEVFAYIRPEKIHLATGDQGGRSHSGSVKTKLFLGSHWMLEVSTAIGVLRVSVPNDGRLMTADEGNSVALTWAAEDLRLLPMTEARDD